MLPTDNAARAPSPAAEEDMIEVEFSYVPPGATHNTMLIQRAKCLPNKTIGELKEQSKQLFGVDAEPHRQTWVIGHTQELLNERPLKDYDQRIPDSQDAMKINVTIRAELDPVMEDHRPQKLLLPE